MTLAPSNSPVTVTSPAATSEQTFMCSFCGRTNFTWFELGNFKYEFEWTEGCLIYSEGYYYVYMFEIFFILVYVFNFQCVL